MEMNTNRLRYIDFAKGVAILLVVMGHIVQYNLKGDSANKIFNFIYSFHMPLFFFLSGYVAALRYEGVCFERVLTFIKKKFISLLVPFLTWGFLLNLLLCRFPISESLLQLNLLVTHPDRGPWFLFTLFIIQAAFLGVRLCVSYFKECEQLAEYFLVVFFIVLIGIIGMMTHNNYINPYYSMAFFAGYFYNKKLAGECKNYILFVSFVLFAILSPKFNFNTSWGGYKMIIGLLASLLMISISKQSTIIFPQLSEKIEWLGRNTLEIYITHIPIIHLFNSYIETGSVLPAPLFLIVFFISVIVAVITVKLSEIISSIPYLRLLAYGKNRSRAITSIS